MRTRRVASDALFGSLVVWLLRAGVIAVVDGPWKTPLEALLFLVGLLLYLGGSVAAGLAITSERTAGPVLLWGFVGFAAGSLLYGIAESAFGLVTPSNAGWIWNEAPLWLAAVLGVIVWLSVQDGLDAT